MVSSEIELNTLRPRQNGHHFPDDIFTCIFLTENWDNLIKISLKFVPKVLINNIPALIQIMAWRRPGDKPLSELMMVNSATHICVTWHQWVKVLVNTSLITVLSHGKLTLDNTLKHTIDVYKDSITVIICVCLQDPSLMSLGDMETSHNIICSSKLTIHLEVHRVKHEIYIYILKCSTNLVYSQHVHSFFLSICPSLCHSTSLQTYIFPEPLIICNFCT